jgi:Tfp pilus assembly major pilin PilA
MLQRRNSTSDRATTTTKRPSSAMTETEVRKMIEKKAYELWEKKGRTVGHELDNWVEAEKIVRGMLK